MNEQELKELVPFLDILRQLSGFHFSAQVGDDGWIQRAKVLKENSANEAHAGRIIAALCRTPRYDDNGNLLTAVPSAIEIGVFARSIPSSVASGTAPLPCDECADLPGWALKEDGGQGTRVLCKCARGEWQRASMGGKPTERKPARLERPSGDWARRAARDVE